MDNVLVNSLKNANEELIAYLIEKGLKVTFAESCTGGLISKMTTDVPGASACFECGFVTYSNEMKKKLIGVSDKTLKEFGAVSYQTAFEMCEGAKKVAEADIGIGVTGIAGPGGGTKEKPVGLVYVGVCTDDFHGTIKLNLSGSREEVRYKTAICAFDLGLRALKKELKNSSDNNMMTEIRYIDAIK